MDKITISSCYGDYVCMRFVIKTNIRGWALIGHHNVEEQ